MTHVLGDGDDYLLGVTLPSPIEDAWDEVSEPFEGITEEEWTDFAAVTLFGAATVIVSFMLPPVGVAILFGLATGVGLAAITEDY